MAIDLNVKHMIINILEQNIREHIWDLELFKEFLDLKHKKGSRNGKK